MYDLRKMLLQAQQSSLRLWILNMLLARVIPFNGPHKLRVAEVFDDGVRVQLPYTRRNLNHIKGLHACALATLAEYTTGLSLLYLLGSKRYRLIMQRIEIDYLYQGKISAEAEFRLSNDDCEALSEEVESEGVVVRPFEVVIRDNESNELCKARVHWQLKDWSKVSTSV